MEGVKVSEEILERTTEELQYLSIARLLTPNQELFTKHLQYSTRVKT